MDQQRGLYGVGEDWAADSRIQGLPIKARGFLLAALAVGATDAEQLEQLAREWGLTGAQWASWGPRIRAGMDAIPGRVRNTLPAWSARVIHNWRAGSVDNSSAEHSPPLHSPPLSTFNRERSSMPKGEPTCRTPEPGSIDRPSLEACSLAVASSKTPSLVELPTPCFPAGTEHTPPQPPPSLGGNMARERLGVKRAWPEILEEWPEVRNLEEQWFAWADAIEGCRPRHKWPLAKRRIWRGRARAWREWGRDRFVFALCRSTEFAWLSVSWSHHERAWEERNAPKRGNRHASRAEAVNAVLRDFIEEDLPKEGRGNDGE